ncbi:uncharacterized protein LOC120698149 [Panicum virgatum]|uniref:uncharacterized protein LOC120698149 n=1 Tax=Panicum virgatum TaxID=38727 RepID=UPI0019D5A134|nr:uncharacterized protein LOC120698149 [Panicum virgatum]
MDKSSTAATATAHLEAIRKREKKKQAQANEGEGISSSVKHKVPRPRAAPAKRFKSPLASKSTRVRMMLSPRVISPSTTLARSSQESQISPFIKKEVCLVTAGWFCSLPSSLQLMFSRAHPLHWQMGVENFMCSETSHLSWQPVVANG